MANPGLILKGARMLSKTPAISKRVKKIEKAMHKYFKDADRKDIVGDMNKYKKGLKGPGATTRTTKPSEVSKSYGQQQKSINNMFANDKLSRDVSTVMKVGTKLIK